MISEEEKKELLALTQESLSISLLTKLFGRSTSKSEGKFIIKEPKFNLRDKMHLDAKEYINIEAVDTTVGSFLFNKLMVEGMLENVIPNGYYNEVVDKKGFNKLIDMISEGLMMNKISVQPTLVKWLKQYEFYGMKATTIFSSSYSEGMLRRNKEIQQYKEKLLKENEIKNVKDMTTVEDALVDKAREVLDKDVGMQLFKSGARGAFENDYKNMNLMLGPVLIPGSDGKYDLVKSNYIEGLKKEDIVPAGNLVINSVYPKSVGTADAGYLTKQYYAAYQSIQCDEDGTDCGTNLGLELLLTEDNIEDYYYQYIIVKGHQYDLLTSENKDRYLNKKVTIRSSMFCKSDKICSVCAGKRFYIMGIKNIGLTSGRVPNTLLNAGMKNFHNAKIKYDEVDISKLLI